MQVDVLVLDHCVSMHYYTVCSAVTNCAGCMCIMRNIGALEEQRDSEKILVRQGGAGSESVDWRDEDLPRKFNFSIFFTCASGGHFPTGTTIGVNIFFRGAYWAWP